MKRTTAILLSVTLSVCLLSSGLLTAFARPVAAAEPIRIGAVLCVTGPGGILGTHAREAATAIVEETNRKGGILGRPVELLIEDDQSSATNAVISETKLIRDRKVSVLISLSTNDSAMAMIPTADQEHVPYAASSPLVAPFRKWVFYVTPNDLLGAARLLEFAATGFGAKRIAILHDTGNYGMVGAKVYRSEVSRYPGASIVIEQSFDAEDTSMVPQLMKIKAANPDLILLQTSSGPAAVIAKNYKQLGLKTPVACIHAVALPDFLAAAGAIAEENKWMFMCAKLGVAELLPVDDPYRKNIYEPFKKLIQEKYGPKPITIFHSVTYDAVHITLEAIKAAASDDRAAIRNAMESLKWEGTLGPFACTPENHRGQQKDNALPVLVQKGQFVLYKR
jgi:branched-chain amino acid transport system substrate-binding protein